MCLFSIRKLFCDLFVLFFWGVFFGCLFFVQEYRSVMGGSTVVEKKKGRQGGQGENAQFVK